MATKYINTDLNVKGNLYLDGEAFTVNTTTVEVEDNILELNRTQGDPDAATATTSGIRIYRGDGVTPADFIFDDSDDTWDLTNNLNVAGTMTATSSYFVGTGENTHINSTGVVAGRSSWYLRPDGNDTRTLFIGGYSDGDYDWAAINIRTAGTVLVSGHLTVSGNLNANASTASKWATARTITLGGDLTGNVSIDGSANVTLTAAVADDSHNHDGRYYTESEIQTFFDRGYINKESATNLAVGWYTIATNTGDRALGEFQIWDTASSDHQSVLFNASHHFGTNSSNDITVLANSRYDGTNFRYIRIKDGNTYDGAALQVYVEGSTNAVNVAIVGGNAQTSGWVLKDWIADATDPGDLSGYSNFSVSCQVDLDLVINGGIITTGEIYSGGTTSQFRVLNTGDEGSGNGLDADTLDGYHLAESTGNLGPTWGRVPVIKTDGVMEVGRYIDFHHTSASSSDYTPRLHTNGSDNGQLYLNNNKIWHEGNDGVGTGLNADLLDNIDSTGFIRDLGDVTVTDFDTLSDGWIGSNETTATNQPYANHHNTFTITNDASAGRKTQLFFADSPGGGFHFRQRQGDTTGWHDWQKVWSSYDFSATQISNWDSASNWGDWSTGVTKTFIDGLNVDADTLDGLDSSKFFRKDQDMIFDRASTRQLVFHSDTNYGSDRAFLYFNENSSFHRTGTENVRFSIGAFNDFANSSVHSDAVDIQGGSRLYLNAGDWDTELDTAIGTPATGSYLDAEPIQFAINNAKIASITTSGFRTNSGKYYKAHGSDTNTLFLSGNASATGTPDQFVIKHNYGNVDIGNYRGSINMTSTTNFTGGNTTFSSNIGVGTTSLSGTNRVEIQATNSYDLSTGGNDTGGILIRGGATTGNGSYTGGIGFGHGTGTVGLAGVQESTDSDLLGIAFFTHPTGTGNAASSEKMRLTATGNLVIGDTTAVAKFHVIDSSFPQVRINDDTGGGESGIRFRSYDGSTGLHGDIFVQKTGNEAGRMGFRVPYTAERMTILHTGQVGINKTNPSYTLDVSGYARLHANSTPTLRLETTNSSTYRAEIQARYSYADPFWISAYNGNKVIATRTGSSYTDLYALGSIKATLTNTGYGVGTTEPQEALHIASGVGIFNVSDNWQQSTYRTSLFRGGNFESSITANTNTIKIYPATSSRAVGDYWGGISFMHLDPENSGWGTSYTGAQMWIGGKIIDQPGQERSAFVIATNNGTTAGTHPTERVRVLPNGSTEVLSNLSTGGAWSASQGVFQCLGDMTISRGAIIRWANTSGETGEYIYSKATSPYDVTIHSGSYDALQCPNTGSVRINYQGAQKFVTTSAGVSITGTMTASADVVAYSDERLKENVKTIDGALDKVKALRGVSYNRNDIDDKTEKIGVIAQEIQKVLPQVVQEQEDGMLGVSYGNIVGVLIEAIKEQNEIIEDLKQRIAKLE